MKTSVIDEQIETINFLIDFYRSKFCIQANESDSVLKISNDVINMLKDMKKIDDEIANENVG